MFQDNPLLAQLKQQLRDNLPKKEGVVRASDRGFGFLETDHRGESYFIAPQQMKRLMHGDRIIAVIRAENGKEQAEPESLITPFLSRFVARIKVIKDRLFVVPDHPVMKDAIKARPMKGLDESQFKEGDWVIANLKRHGMNDASGHFAEITEYVTHNNDPEAPWWVVLRRHDLPRCAPDIEQEWQLREEGLIREDLTALPFVTIDGESTRDMDDALHIEKTADGWKMLVAIADPTAYIEPGSALDLEASKRAFTVYLPGRNIPMIPRHLSDELCSLHEGEDRPALCCEMLITADGELLPEPRFFAANIRSQGRLIYDQLSDWLENGSAEGFAPAPAIVEQIEQLQAATTARQNWRKEHAILFKDRPDYDFELNEAGEVVAIHASFRRSANKIVEEAMIAANQCAGDFLARNPGYGIFNVHAGLDVEKFKGVQELLQQHDAPLTDETLLTLPGFCQLRHWLDAQPTSYLDNRIRRFQTYALMSAEPGPHFGLGLSHYATWTSPIRKYGDMINHRILKAIISQQDVPVRADATLTDALSLSRRSNRMAERDIGDWLYARFLLPAVASGQVFDAEIMDVMRSGIKVRLLENGAVCFVPGSLILKDRKRFICNHDEGRAMLDGEIYYELGQTIQVKLQDAIEATRTLIAIPTELPPAAAPVVTKEALAESEHELMDELLTEPADTAPEQDEA